MRLFIVSREAQVVPGLYMGPHPRAKDRKARTQAALESVWDQYVRMKSTGNWDPLLKTLFPWGSLLAFAIKKRLEAEMQNPERFLAEAAFAQGMSLVQGIEASTELMRMLQSCKDALVLPPKEMPAGLAPYEHHCLTITRITEVGASADLTAESPLLLGSFTGQEQLAAALAADGGNSRIHIFNLQDARKHLRRHGGGVLEEGLYLLHPKRDDVLVPFRGFHMEMLQEMTREARVVMGRLGAKRLVIETVEGVNFGGKLSIPMKGGGEAGGSREKLDRVTFEWGTPTFEPEHALSDCVWIQDNAGVMTIVDQRKTSNLTRYEEYSRINTSFNVSLEVMKAFNAGFEWAQESTYSYTVDFFSR